MNDATKYIHEVFGVKLNLKKIPKEQSNAIPFYILNDYTIWTGNLFNKKIFFAKKNTQEHFTPDQYKKHLELLEKKLANPVILILPDIKAYNRNRLIQKHINFIIENKQIFIPFLMIDLKEYLTKPEQKNILQPAAQCMILYHLQKQILNYLNYKQIAELLQYSYLTISRAVENLNTLGVCRVEGTKVKTIVFTLDKKELWGKALPFMKTPVKKKVYINDILPDELIFKTNINALAYYTDLNDDDYLYYAINHTNFKNLHKEGKIKMYSEYDGNYIIETWKYAPGILANNKYADPLSLYLTFKDTQDERIEMALEQIIKDYIW